MLSDSRQPEVDILDILYKNHMCMSFDKSPIRLWIPENASQSFMNLRYMLRVRWGKTLSGEKVNCVFLVYDENSVIFFYNTRHFSNPWMSDICTRSYSKLAGIHINQIWLNLHPFSCNFSDILLWRLFGFVLLIAEFAMVLLQMILFSLTWNRFFPWYVLIFVWLFETKKWSSGQNAQQCLGRAKRLYRCAWAFSPRFC